MKVFIIKNKKYLYKFIILLFWLGIWEIAALWIDKEIYLPSPYQTFNTLVKLVVVKEFWDTIFMTMLRVIGGFLISCIMGSITGILCGLNRFLYEFFHPLIVSLKSTPVMSFIIIALIWIRSDYVPIFICFLMCYPIIWTSVVEGMKQIDSKLLEMSKVFKVRNSLVIKKIYIPSIKPYLIAGMVTSLGLGWKVTVAAEVLSNSRLSIGGNLYNAKVYLESEMLFAWTIVIIVLSFIFEYIFKKFVKSFFIKGGEEYDRN